MNGEIAWAACFLVVFGIFHLMRSFVWWCGFVVFSFSVDEIMNKTTKLPFPCFITFCQNFTHPLDKGIKFVNNINAKYQRHSIVGDLCSCHELCVTSSANSLRC